MSYILAIDPGSKKCGIAVIEIETLVSPLKKIVKTDELCGEISELIEKYSIRIIVSGNGTCCSKIAKDVKKVLNYDCSEDVTFEFIDEKNSTYEARFIYFKENPPKFPFNLLPKGLIPVDSPIDHYAAFIIGKNYLEKIYNRTL